MGLHAAWTGMELLGSSDDPPALAFLVATGTTPDLCHS
jgi:hypothetical protein